MRKEHKILFIVFFVVVIVGFGAFFFYLSGADDLKFESHYTDELFTIKDIAETDPHMVAHYCCGFTVIDGASVYDAVSKTDEYLYSFDATGGKSKEDTGMFLLHKNNTYVFVISDATEKNTCYIGEPILEGVYFPKWFDINEIISKGLEAEPDSTEMKERFEWNRLIGIRSFEDLVEYYHGIDPGLYEVDEANKLVFLRGGLSQSDDPFQAVIKADDTGVTYVPLSDSNDTMYSREYWVKNPAKAASEV